MTDLRNYQDFTRTTAVYPGAQTGAVIALGYLSLGLAGEAGEVANKVKKVIRGDYVKPEPAFAPRSIDPREATPEAVRAAVLAELGDVAYYLARLVDELGGDLQDVFQSNIDKLSDRKARGVIKGSGDER